MLVSIYAIILVRWTLRLYPRHLHAQPFELCTTLYREALETVRDRESEPEVFSPPDSHITLHWTGCVYSPYSNCTFLLTRSG